MLLMACLLLVVASVLIIIVGTNPQLISKQLAVLVLVILGLCGGALYCTAQLNQEAKEQYQ